LLLYENIKSLEFLIRFAGKLRMLVVWENGYNSLNIFKLIYFNCLVNLLDLIKYFS